VGELVHEDERRAVRDVAPGLVVAEDRRRPGDDGGRDVQDVGRGKGAAKGRRERGEKGGRTLGDRHVDDVQLDAGGVAQDTAVPCGELGRARREGLLEQLGPYQRRRDDAPVPRRGRFEKQLNRGSPRRARRAFDEIDERRAVDEDERVGGKVDAGGMSLQAPTSTLLRPASLQA